MAQLAKIVFGSCLAQCPGPNSDRTFSQIKVQGFRGAEGRFPELLRILENEGATSSGGWRRAFRTGGIGWQDSARSSYGEKIQTQFAARPARGTYTIL
jgi:hypothetical protein